MDSKWALLLACFLLATFLVNASADIRPLVTIVKSIRLRCSGHVDPLTEEPAILAYLDWVQLRRNRYYYEGGNDQGAAKAVGSCQFPALRDDTLRHLMDPKRNEQHHTLHVEFAQVPPEPLKEDILIAGLFDVRLLREVPTTTLKSRRFEFESESYFVEGPDLVQDHRYLYRTPSGLY